MGHRYLISSEIDDKLIPGALGRWIQRFVAHWWKNRRCLPERLSFSWCTVKSGVCLSLQITLKSTGTDIPSNRAVVVSAVPHNLWGLSYSKVGLTKTVLYCSQCHIFSQEQISSPNPLGTNEKIEAWLEELRRSRPRSMNRMAGSHNQRYTKSVLRRGERCLRLGGAEIISRPALVGLLYRGRQNEVSDRSFISRC